MTQERHDKSAGGESLETVADFRGITPRLSNTGNSFVTYPKPFNAQQALTGTAAATDKGGKKQQAQMPALSLNTLQSALTAGHVATPFNMTDRQRQQQLQATMPVQHAGIAGGLLATERSAASTTNAYDLNN